MRVTMARNPVKLPDYFTTEEASALVDKVPSYPVKMAMRVMLRTGLRIGECLSLRPADLRFDQDPPIISLRPEVTGNKAKRGREIPIPAGLASAVCTPHLTRRTKKEHLLTPSARRDTHPFGGLGLKTRGDSNLSPVPYD